MSRDVPTTVGPQSEPDDGLPAGAVATVPSLVLPSIEGYEILREISRGGQGVVYQSLQRSTRQKVAVKVLLDGAYASPALNKRFVREIELAAALKHPNIVSVLDSGLTTDGRRFCVMEYIRGTPILAYVREARPTLEGALRLFRVVCEAVAYAHQRGVIHRDLKPSNILVDADGVPRVLDFGLAKTLTDNSDISVSQTGQLVGTLHYMSPEQTRGNPDEIDTRSDVYSLGVILYELLTARLPYPTGGSLPEALRHITATDAASPRANWSETSGIDRTDVHPSHSNRCPIDDEVSTIILKALSKDRERRYQTAGEFARDLGHYLAGEPIEAKRDSALYVLRKTLSRYRGPVLAAVLVVFVAAVGLVASTAAWHRAARDRDSAVAAESESRRAEQLASNARADERRQRQAAEQVLVSLQQEGQLGRLFVARAYAHEHDFAAARAALTAIDPLPSVMQDWRWAAWEYLRRSRETARDDLNAHVSPSRRLRPARSSDGSATIDVIQRRILAWTDGKPFVFNLDTGDPLPGDPLDPPRAPAAQFLAPEIVRENTLGGRHVRISVVRKNDQMTCKLELLRPDGSIAWSETIPPPGLQGVGSLSLDGNHVALAMENGSIQFRRILDDRSELESTIEGIQDDVVAMKFEPNGLHLHVVTGGWVHHVFSTAAEPDVDAAPAAHTSTTRRLAFDATGRWLVSGSYDGHVKVWDAATHIELTDLLAMDKARGPITGVHQVGFLPDGRVFAATVGSTVRVWDWRAGTPPITCQTNESNLGGVAFAADGRSMYCSGSNHLAKWDLLAGRMDGPPFGQADSMELDYRLIWLPERNRLIALRSNRDVTDPSSVRCEIWDTQGPRLVNTLRYHTDALRDADLSPDQTVLAIASRDGRATLWDWQRGEVLRVLDVRPGHAHSNIVSAIRFHPSEPVVVTASHDNRVIFWSTQTGRQLAELNVDEQHQLGYGPTGQLKDLAFSPDGRTLAITVADGIWWLNLATFDQQIAGLARERREKAPSILPVEASDATGSIGPVR